MANELMTKQESAIDEQAFEELRAGTRGEIIRPEHDGYDGARSVWNAMIDRRPALIVRCAGVADVISAATFAHSHDLPVSVAEADTTWLARRSATAASSSTCRT